MILESIYEVGELEFLTLYQRLKAISDQIASITPKGQAPWRNP